MPSAKASRRDTDRPVLAVCAILSAISLALPTGIFLFAVWSGSAQGRAAANVTSIVIAAGLGIAYAAIAFTARDSGAAMIAGTSTTLGVLGVVALIPILFLSWLDSASGGHTMGMVTFWTLVYLAAQFGIAAAARAVAGAGEKVRASGGFRLGAALPLLLAFVLYGIARNRPNADTEQAIANVRVREKVRGDLFALYACATAHRAFAPRREYPATLRALGAQGDKCLPAAIEKEERGFTFEYTPRMSGGETVVGFTVRAQPRTHLADETMLTMDEHAIIEEDWINSRYSSLPLRTPPGLDILVAMRDCEKLYRHYRRRAPSDLRTLRAFGDTTLDRAFPVACWTLRTVNSSLEWAEYSQQRKLNEWTGPGYTLTFHPESASRPVTYDVRPKSWGVTGIWSYLGVSPGAIYGTTEPRAATIADEAIPVCEFGAPPAGSPQCIPGNSPPPNARLVVDSVADGRGFRVALAGAADSGSASTRDDTTATPRAATTPEFEYLFACDWIEKEIYVKDSSYTCHPNWHSDSVQVRARIRNRDLTMREYTRWVHVRRPPLVLRIATPKPVLLGEPFELQPSAVGRDSSERFDLTVRMGDASPTHRSSWPNGATLNCSSPPNPSWWDCVYPAKPGTYRVTVTAKSWKGDTASATGRVVVRPPK